MRVYLDNCCYNRPFDDQTQVKVLIETLAKLNIQSLPNKSAMLKWSENTNITQREGQWTRNVSQLSFLFSRI